MFSIIKSGDINQVEMNASDIDYMYIFSSSFLTHQAPPRFQHSHGNLIPAPATLLHKKVTSALSSRVLFYFE